MYKRKSCNTINLKLSQPLILCPRCNNLLQNPSFEAGLDGWLVNNVFATNDTPFEGTQSARMGQGVASLSQDVELTILTKYPLFFSFNAYPGADNSSNGNLIIEILWLNSNHDIIGTGLRKLIPNGAINRSVRITYFDITDLPPTGTVFARLLFSKETGTAPDTIEIDQVILTPTKSINLVQNPGFELGLTDWTTTAFTPNFSETFEGAGVALTTTNSNLFQDIPLTNMTFKSPLMLSFAVTASETDGASLAVQVLWLNNAGSVIGTGLDLIISRNTLVAQGVYLTYLDITNIPPADAVTARIFITTTDAMADTRLRLDQVILSKVITPNLVQNPSFENLFSNWTTVNAEVLLSNLVYEGDHAARILPSGGALFQDIPVIRAAGHCFLLNFGYYALITEPGNLLAEVHWLDINNREIGIGLSLVIPSNAEPNTWIVYAGITEPAPPATVTARVQFTKSFGNSSVANINIDKVVFSRLV